MGNYIAADIKAGTLGDSIRCNDQVIDEDVNFTIGALNYATADVYMMGNTSVPVIGIFDDSSFTINWRNFTKEIARAFNPELNKYEIRWNDLVVDRNNTKQKKVTHKVVIEGWPKGILPEMGITVQENTEFPSEHTLVSIRYFIDGDEILYFHKTQKAYRWMGKDIFQDLRDGL